MTARSRSQHLARRMRLSAVAALGLAVSGLGATAGMASQAAPDAAARTQSMPVPVDRQFYVTSSTTTNPSDGSTVDAYDNDPSSIHVAINGGSEFARSFVHLALDYIPTGARLTQVTMTMHVTSQSDASSAGIYPLYNVNTSQAIVEACALKTELAGNFDYKNPPAYDCEHGSAVGKPNQAGDTWTFHLKGLIDYWRQHGNTGAALVPIGSGDPSQSWAVAFYKSRSSSVVTFVPPSTSPVAGHHAAPPPAGTTTTTGTSTTGGQPQSAGSSTDAGVPPAAPLPAGNATATTPATTVTAPTVAGQPAAPGLSPVRTQSSTTTRHGVTRYWPLVLVGCLALAALALGAAHRDRLAQLVTPTVGAFRAHPRAYAVASVAAVWGLVFSGYSLVVQPTTTGSQANVASNAPAQQLAPGGVASAGAPTAGGAPLVGASGQPLVQGAQSGGGSTNGAVVSSPGARHRNPATTELTGPGTYKVIGGVRVFFPADGGPPVADLYHGADDTIGITPSSIKLCAHAALTYGSAFHIDKSDLNVYWQWLNDHGGIFGRKVETNYTNDNYDPGTAVQAAQACKDWGTFMLLGGIGFDQIPAVRQWAEQNHMLYLHHVATVENTAGLRYSFSALPSVEQLGEQMGRIAAWKFRGKKVGIIYRNSSNWSPGVATFEKVVRAAGMQIVGSYPVTINQGNYTQEIAQLQAKGAQLVFAWENALSSIEIIKQAQGQDYHPAWLVAAFNIITNTLGSTAMDQDMWGAAAWDAYDPNYYGGGFASYASDIKEFEAEYKHYDPNADLSGDGGDLLFGAWESWRFVADLLKTCGPDCTRNKMAGLLLAGYHKTVSPNCPVDFRLGDHHHGGYLFNALHVEKDPNGRPNWVPVQRCVPNLGTGG